MATVDQLITDARTYASNVLSDSQRAMSSATQAITGVGYLIPSVDPLTLDTPLELPTLRATPQMRGADLALPPEPGKAPEYQDIGAIDISGAPSLSFNAPTVLLPDRPTALAGFTQQAPTINTTVAFPEPPDQLVNPTFSEPVLAERAAPVKPLVQLPDFTAQVPVNTSRAPEDLPGQMDAAYQRLSPIMTAVIEGQVDAFIAKHNPRFKEQMGRIEDRLAKYLEGGTALAPAVEAAIYERARDRNNAEYQRVRETAWEDAAARGHTLPDGALQSAVRLARQGAADNQARTNAEIAIKQAELEQQNLQFAVTTSANLRSVILNAAMNYHQSLVAINGQALDYAKSLAGLLVESFNVAVRAYQAALDGYRAEVQAFEVRLRAVMGAIEIYKAEIDALQALTQVDLARVNVYRARIETLQALAGVYRSRIDAVVAKASMEKLKLDLFGSQVQLYTAQVQAKGVEWGGYRAAIEGEQSKVQLFGEEVRAGGMSAQVWKTKIDAQAEAVRAAATTNEARARQYEAAQRSYTAVVQARGEVARTKLENDRQLLQAFQAETQAQVSFANTAATYYKTRADVQISYADQKLRAQLGMADSMRGFQSTLAHLAITNAQQYTGLAQTVTAGMNTLVAQEGP